MSTPTPPDTALLLAAAHLAAGAQSASSTCLVEEDFGIPVMTVYGADEAFGIGFECERHTDLHLTWTLYPGGSRASSRG